MVSVCSTISNAKGPIGSAHFYTSSSSSNYRAGCFFISKNILPTVRESERPLQRGTSCWFVNTASNSFIFRTLIPLPELHEVLSNFFHVVGDLSWANRVQTSIEKLLQTISRLGFYMQEEATFGRGELWIHLTVTMNGPRSDFCAIDGTQQRRIIISCAVTFPLLETSWHPKWRISAPSPLTISTWPLAVSVMLPTPKINGILSRGVSLTLKERSPFIDVGLTRMKIIVLRQKLVVLAVVFQNTHQTYVCTSPICLSYEFWCLSRFAIPFFRFHAPRFFWIDKPSPYWFILFSFLTSFFIVIIFDLYSFFSRRCLGASLILVFQLVNFSGLQRTAWEYVVFMSQRVEVVEFSVMIYFIWCRGSQFWLCS